MGLLMLLCIENAREIFKKSKLKFSGKKPKQTNNNKNKKNNQKNQNPKLPSLYVILKKGE